MALAGASRHTVILRLWSEAPGTAGGPEEWRGEAVHVPSGNVLYFRTLEAMLPTVQKLLFAHDAGSGTP
jgi:hypothetical protein